MMLAALLLAAAEPETAIDAERAFAKDAQEMGQWTAFAKWSAPNGRLVGDQLIDAIPFAEAQEDPEQSLHWWPVENWTNCDGTYAFNVGGWEDPATGEKGRFHTVWVKTDEGWRYIIDMGATGEEYYLPRTDEVKEHRAACDRPQPPPILYVYPLLTKADGGSSSDQTLEYRLVIGPDDKRAIVISMWDGDRHDPVYLLKWQAQ